MIVLLCVLGVFLMCRREESGAYIVRESLGTNWGAKGHICPSKTACRGLGIRCAAVGHDGTLATVISAV